MGTKTQSASAQSVLAGLGFASLREAADYVRDCGMPAELCALTGHTAIELDMALIGKGMPIGITMTDCAEAEGGGYIVGLQVSTVVKNGRFAAFGEGNTALKQGEPNPAGKAQWWSLNAKVFLPEAPAGAEEIFDRSVEYYKEAKAVKKDFGTKKSENRVWLWGSVRFTLATGGKFGLWINALDLSSATWHGSGSGTTPIESSTLDSVLVDDVSGLFDAPAAAPAPTAPAVGTGGTRRARSTRAS